MQKLYYNSNSSYMKRKIIRAPNQGHKILEQQSGKLKEKLESLKQQIQQKKKEKQMNKQNQLAQSRNLQNSSLSKSKSKQKLDSEPSEFTQFLCTLQMDHLASKLNEKSINTLEQLKSIQPDVIDQWKDIPVGYRIKLKKQLNVAKPSNSPSPQKKLSLPKQKLIEDIVDVRKKEKIFVPLQGQGEQEEQTQQKLELSENEQEEMIQSLMDAFNRSDQIQEIQLSPNKKTAVVLQSKEAWGQRQNFPNYRYCWTCLKKLQQETLQTYQNRQFCGQNCLQGYKGVIKVEQDNKLFAEIEETENKFSKYLQNRKEKGKNLRHNKRMDGKHEQEETIIDFQIL